MAMSLSTGYKELIQKLCRVYKQIYRQTLCKDVIFLLK